MKRQHPFITTFGFLLTLLFLAGLGMSLWTSGGTAFSPGSLSARSKPASALKGFSSHADFEDRCALCHDPLKNQQGVLCLACHEDTAAEIDRRLGTHGLILDATRCATCHRDHRGPDYDMTASAYPHYDHEVTRFSLLKHQLGYDAGLLECQSCHAADDFVVSELGCIRCHGDHDAVFMINHLQGYGEACLFCHDGRDSMVSFDHQSTRFPLDGRHAGVRCADCHRFDPSLQTGVVSAPADSPTGSPFRGLPLECSGCHVEPEVHLGLYPTSCENCHITSAWLPAVVDGNIFAHNEVTGFSLVRHESDYLGAAILCTGCHEPGGQNVDLQVCVTCHVAAPEGVRFMSEHQALFGGDCLQCHDGADRMSEFDHANFFPLDGRHNELECAACHVEKQFDGTPGECAQCHTEPEIHAGFFGLQCQYCHTALAWTPAQLRLHTFPLDHGEVGEVACQVCHPGSYNQDTCYGCHEHQPNPIAAVHVEVGISAQDLPDCAACHPTGLVESQDG